MKKIVLQVWEVLELGSSEIKRNRGSITLYKQQQGWVQNWVRSRKMEPMLLGNKLLKTYHESVFGKGKPREKGGIWCCQEHTLKLIALSFGWKCSIPFAALVPELCPAGHVPPDHPALTQPLQRGLETVIGHQAYKLQPHCNTLILIITPIYHKITVSQGYYYPTGGV